MKVRTRQLAPIIALVAVVAWIALAAPGPRIENAQPGEAQPQFGATTTVLFDLADDLSDDERAAFLRTLPNAELNSIYSEDEGLYRLTLPTSEALELIDSLEGAEEIEFVEPEFIYTLEAFEVSAGGVDDPLYQFQWHFDQIELESAWKRADGSGVVVAVIDTGVAFSDADYGGLRQVRDLSGTTFVGGYDFVSDDDQPHDEHGHGTHVAGTIAQTTNNGYGVAGIAPGAAIMPIRVLDASGRGSTADIAESIRWAADNGADVINMSLGGPLPSRIMQDAVAYAHRHGVTVIAAAGNSGWSMPSFPAAYPNVVAVAATQFDRNTTFYSNYGRYIDIAAPGGNTQLDQNGDGRPDGVMQETLAREDPSEHEFALYMGTSMASPHVAGVAALIHQQGVTHPDRVEELLRASSTQQVPEYRQDRYGAGLLNADDATESTITRFQLPRAALALVLVLLGFSSSKRSSGTRPMSPAAAGAGAVFGATGLALAALVASALGISVGGMAGLAASPVRWIDTLGCGTLGSSMLVLSALPAIAVYALAGGSRSKALSGLVVGLLTGFAAFLCGEALVSSMDVGGIPGLGLLDRLWLGVNGIIAVLLALAAYRRR